TAVRRSAIAQLAVEVVAPTQDAAILQGACVAAARADRRDAGGKARKRHRYRAVYRPPVPKLAEFVAAPALEAAVYQRTGMLETIGADRRHAAAQAAHRNGHAAVRRRTVPEHAGAVIAPTRRASVLDRARVPVTCVERRYAGAQANDRNG